MVGTPRKPNILKRNSTHGHSMSGVSGRPFGNRVLKMCLPFDSASLKKVKSVLPSPLRMSLMIWVLGLADILSPVKADLMSLWSAKTTTVSCPILYEKTRPYSSASFCRYSCIGRLIWYMMPVTGRPHGPGGRCRRVRNHLQKNTNAAKPTRPAVTPTNRSVFTRCNFILCVCSLVSVWVWNGFKI